MFSVINILKAILIGFFTGFVASIPLGPSGLESVSRSISKGFKEGFKVSLGAVSADITYIVIINLGLFTILTRNPKFHSLFWIVSGIVLIISNKISFTAKKPDFNLEKSIYRRSSNGFLNWFFDNVSQSNNSIIMDCIKWNHIQCLETSWKDIFYILNLINDNWKYNLVLLS